MDNGRQSKPDRNDAQPAFISPEAKFWNLREPEDKNSQKFRTNWDDSVELEQIVCPVYPNHKSAGRRATDLSVVLTKRQTFDIMWTWHNECLIQPRILKAFQEQGFTGFDVKPAHARFEHRVLGEPPVFWELVVTGWAGLSHLNRESGLTELRAAHIAGVSGIRKLKTIRG